MTLFQTLLQAVLAGLLAGGYALQPPGQFQSGEAIARDGERWLALQLAGDGATLIATRVQVRPVPDPPGTRPGRVREVSAGGDFSGRDAAVLAYLRGQRLTPGPVEQARFTPRERGGPGLPAYAIRFRDRDYRIDTQCDPEPRDARVEPLEYDCFIVLRAGADSTVLVLQPGTHVNGAAQLSLGASGNAGLVFAGDLDRDGRLDLIFDSSDQLEHACPALFLSSPAKRGELLRPVAQFAAGGC
jgi:hypothetical protein